MTTCYVFTITISAIADNPQDAWDEAVTQLAIDPGPCPKEYFKEVVED